MTKNTQILYKFNAYRYRPTNFVPINLNFFVYLMWFTKYNLQRKIQNRNFRCWKTQTLVGLVPFFVHRFYNNLLVRGQIVLNAFLTRFLSLRLRRIPCAILIYIYLIDARIGCDHTVRIACRWVCRPSWRIDKIGIINSWKRLSKLTLNFRFFAREQTDKYKQKYGYAKNDPFLYART